MHCKKGLLCGAEAGMRNVSGLVPYRQAVSRLISGKARISLGLFSKKEEEQPWGEWIQGDYSCESIRLAAISS